MKVHVCIGVNCSCFSTCRVLGGASDAEKLKSSSALFHYFMGKKEYQKPESEIILVDATSILEGSTGATGEDVPWGAKERDIFEALSIE